MLGALNAYRPDICLVIVVQCYIPEEITSNIRDQPSSSRKISRGACWSGSQSKAGSSKWDSKGDKSAQLWSSVTHQQTTVSKTSKSLNQNWRTHCVVRWRFWWEISRQMLEMTTGTTKGPWGEKYVAPWRTMETGYWTSRPPLILSLEGRSFHTETSTSCPSTRSMEETTTRLTTW